MTSDGQNNGNDLLLDLNFEPDWAKKAPGETRYEDRDDGKPRRDRSARGPRDRDRGLRRDRPPRDDRGPRKDRDRDAREPRPPRIEPLNADVHFLPEKNNIGAVVHLVRTRKQAFPLFKLASIFLTDPKHYLIKLTAPKDQPLEFHQCGICQLVFLKPADLQQHILASHLDEFFTIEEKETEPPAGRFVCVGRCPKTGVLLGPPNYHGFNAALQELHAKHYPNMTSQECRANIEMVHDPEVIEKWRDSCRKTTVYRPKDAPADAPGMTREQAEAVMREKHLAKMMQRKSRVIMPASLVPQVVDAALTARLRQAWNRETRHPFTLAIALQPALKHMGLHVFRGKGGDHYVTAIKPSPIDANHAVPLIRAIVEFVRANPGCMRTALIEAVAPGSAPDSKEASEAGQSLAWLVEKGHLIEFFDGTLLLPGDGAREGDRSSTGEESS